MKGGFRKGAGRKRLPPELKKRIITVHLKQATVAWMRLQDGSYSNIIEHHLSLPVAKQGKQIQKEEK